MNDDYDRTEKRLKLTLNKKRNASVALTLNKEDVNAVVHGKHDDDLKSKSDEPKQQQQQGARVKPEVATDGSPGGGGGGGDSLSLSLPVATLRNLGNTCYLSSVLQALRWIGGKLTRHLHDNDTPSKMRKTGKKKQGKVLAENDNICVQIHRLFQEMHRVECEDGSEGDKNKERTVVDLSPLLSTIRKVDGRYEGNDQHDAHELLSIVLDAIQKTCRDRNSTPMKGITRNRKRKRRTKKKKTEEEDEECLFQGKISFRTKCVECEDTLETEDIFWDVPLSLTTSKKERQHDDDQCLRDDNKFWCDGCVHYNEAHRYTHFKQLPTFLFVRVEHSIATSTTSGIHKTSEGTVDVPLELPCLLDSCSKPCSSSLRHSYRLKSVICHTGATYSSGHYTTYVRREIPCTLKRQKNKKNGGGEERAIYCCGVESSSNDPDLKPLTSWLYFDDDKVSSFDSLPKFDVKYSTVVPYLLLYSSDYSENKN